MGLVDVFTAEARLELNFSEFYNLTKEACKAQLMMNAINCNVPHEYIRETMSGKMESPVILPEVEFSQDCEIENITTSTRHFLRMLPDEDRLSNGADTLKSIIEIAQRERLNEIILDNAEKLRARDSAGEKEKAEA